MSRLKWGMAFAVSIIAICLAATLLILRIPAPVRDLYFHEVALREYAESLSNQPSALSNSTRVFHHPVSNRIFDIGYDSVVQEGELLIFHHYGTALKSYEECLVYGLRIPASPTEVRKSPYLQPSYGSAIVEISQYDRWVYVRIEEE